MSESNRGTLTSRHYIRKGFDTRMHTLTIHGEPASKSNARQLVLIRGRMVPIKSKKALTYSRAFTQQCPTLDPQMDEDLIIAMKIFYKSRRPDLDESLVLDLLQGPVYKNDRSVKMKYVQHGLSKENPRVVMAIGPLAQASEVIKRYEALLTEDAKSYP